MKTVNEWNVLYRTSRNFAKPVLVVSWRDAKCVERVNARQIFFYFMTQDIRVRTLRYALEFFADLCLLIKSVLQFEV